MCFGQLLERALTSVVSMLQTLTIRQLLAWRIPVAMVIVCLLLAQNRAASEVQEPNYM